MPVTFHTDDDNRFYAEPSVSFAVSKVYTVATVPAAASGNLSMIIWVLDAPKGQRLQYSNGAAWIPITQQ